MRKGLSALLVLSVVLSGVSLAGVGPWEVLGEVSDRLYSTGFNGFRNQVETRVRAAGRVLYGAFTDRVEAANPFFDPERAVRLRSARGGTGNWVGSPSSLAVRGEGIYLYTRSRGPERRGFRGSIIQLGSRMETIWTVHKEEIGALSIEGAAIGKRDGGYVLYLSYQNGSSGRWEIMKMTSSSISGFQPSEARRLRFDTGFTHYKDPVLHDGKLYVHASSSSFTEQATLVYRTGDSGPEYLREISFGPGSGRAPRLDSILDVNGSQLVFYDWRPSIFHVTQERSRYGFLRNGKVFVGSDPGEAIRSSAGSGALRYMSVELFNGSAWFFYERSERDGGHGVYMNRVPAETFRSTVSSLKKE
ncbi:MAG: hypothetical protein ABEK01_03945 [Candidatus Nanohaloarchaea archaeon]